MAYASNNSGTVRGLCGKSVFVKAIPLFSGGGLHKQVLISAGFN
jgi:hypothetical protein